MNSLKKYLKTLGLDRPDLSCTSNINPSLKLRVLCDNEGHIIILQMNALINGPFTVPSELTYLQELTILPNNPAGNDENTPQTNLTSLVIPTAIKSLSMIWASGSSFSELTLPENCESLRYLIIPDSQINSLNLTNCYNLDYINYQNTNLNNLVMFPFPNSGLIIVKSDAEMTTGRRKLNSIAENGFADNFLLLIALVGKFQRLPEAIVQSAIRNYKIQIPDLNTKEEWNRAYEKSVFQLFQNGTGIANETPMLSQFQTEKIQSTTKDTMEKTLNELSRPSVSSDISVLTNYLKSKNIQFPENLSCFSNTEQTDDLVLTCDSDSNIISLKMYGLVKGEFKVPDTLLNLRELTILHFHPKDITQFNKASEMTSLEIPGGLVNFHTLWVSGNSLTTLTLDSTLKNLRLVTILDSNLQSLNLINHNFLELVNFRTNQSDAVLIIPDNCDASLILSEQVKIPSRNAKKKRFEGFTLTKKPTTSSTYNLRLRAGSKFQKNSIKIDEFVSNGYPDTALNIVSQIDSYITYVKTAFFLYRITNFVTCNFAPELCNSLEEQFRDVIRFVESVSETVQNNPLYQVFDYILGWNSPMSLGLGLNKQLASIKSTTFLKKAYRYGLEFLNFGLDYLTGMVFDGNLDDIGKVAYDWVTARTTAKLLAVIYPNSTCKANSDGSVSTFDLIQYSVPSNQLMFSQEMTVTIFKSKIHVAARYVTNGNNVWSIAEIKAKISEDTTISLWSLNNTLQQHVSKENAVYSMHGGIYEKAFGSVLLTVEMDRDTLNVTLTILGVDEPILFNPSKIEGICNPYLNSKSSNKLVGKTQDYEVESRGIKSFFDEWIDSTLFETTTDRNAPLFGTTTVPAAQNFRYNAPSYLNSWIFPYSDSNGPFRNTSIPHTFETKNGQVLGDGSGVTVFIVGAPIDTSHIEFSAQRGLDAANIVVPKDENCYAKNTNVYKDNTATSSASLIVGRTLGSSLDSTVYSISPSATYDEVTGKLVDNSFNLKQSFKCIQSIVSEFPNGKFIVQISAGISLLSNYLNEISELENLGIVFVADESPTFNAENQVSTSIVIAGRTNLLKSVRNSVTVPSTNVKVAVKSMEMTDLYSFDSSASTASAIVSGIFASSWGKSITNLGSLKALYGNALMRSLEKMRMDLNVYGTSCEYVKTECVFATLECMSCMI